MIDVKEESRMTLRLLPRANENMRWPSTEIRKDRGSRLGGSKISGLQCL